MKLQDVYDLIVESGVGQFSGAGIIFFDGTNVLLLRKNNGTWVFPGGKPIEGETPLQTAKRETKEEVGRVSGDNIAELRFELDSRTFYSYIFKIKKPFDVELSDEHKDYTWINYKKVRDMKLHKNIFKSLKHVIKKLNTLKVEIF
jgi:8-oxo-dGTP pyrophosphatase MutT (NUDIX family)